MKGTHLCTECFKRFPNDAWEHDCFGLSNLETKGINELKTMLLNQNEDKISLEKRINKLQDEFNTKECELMVCGRMLEEYRINHMKCSERLIYIKDQKNMLLKLIQVYQQEVFKDHEDHKNPVNFTNYMNDEEFKEFKEFKKFKNSKDSKDSKDRITINNIKNTKEEIKNIRSPKKKQKTTIPPKLKEKVWKTYSKNSPITFCPICESTPISYFSFDCGRVVAESNGGTLDLSNLRPICGSCNSSMCSKDMRDYAKEFFPTSPIFLTFLSKTGQFFLFL